MFMKKCFKCGIDKPITDFYAHKGMLDGHLNKCKSCTKEDTAKRSAILVSTPEGLEKERKRHREKYYRLEYNEKHKPSPESKKESTRKYRATHSEKYKATGRSSDIILNTPGNEKHHWSYQKNHAKDIIELTPKFHAKLHRFLKYDKNTFMYFSRDGVLLDTREKHLDYIKYVSGQPN